jgi:hypothetical protein
MNKPIHQKTWNELEPGQVTHFFNLMAGRAEKLGNMTNDVWMEFAKYLFAANAGAAAGLFLLPDSSEQRWYLLAFSLFCGGAAFVGVAWISGWLWFIKLSDGWSQDFNALTDGKLTFGEVDARNRDRHRSLGKHLSRLGLIASFILLLAGGAVAASAFWTNPASIPADRPVTATR